MNMQRGPKNFPSGVLKKWYLKDGGGQVVGIITRDERLGKWISHFAKDDHSLVFHNLEQALAVFKVAGNLSVSAPVSDGDRIDRTWSGFRIGLC